MDNTVHQMFAILKHHGQIDDGEDTESDDTGSDYTESDDIESEDIESEDMESDEIESNEEEAEELSLPTPEERTEAAETAEENVVPVYEDVVWVMQEVV